MLVEWREGAWGRMGGWVLTRRRLEVRKQAMEKMPALIEKWKRMKHGRRWRDWPSGKKMV